MKQNYNTCQWQCVIDISCLLKYESTPAILGASLLFVAQFNSLVTSLAGSGVPNLPKQMLSCLNINYHHTAKIRLKLQTTCHQHRAFIYYFFQIRKPDFIKKDKGTRELKAI